MYVEKDILDESKNGGTFESQRFSDNNKTEIAIILKLSALPSLTHYNRDTVV